MINSRRSFNFHTFFMSGVPDFNERDEGRGGDGAPRDPKQRIERAQYILNFTNAINSSISVSTDG